MITLYAVKDFAVSNQGLNVGHQSDKNGLAGELRLELLQ